MAAKVEVIYIATNGLVAAINAGTGAEIWRVKLPNGAGANPLTLLIWGERLFVGGKGRVWCLSRSSGAVVWENGLPKMGYQAVLMALEGATGGSDGAAAEMVQVIRRRQAAAAAAS